MTSSLPALGANYKASRVTEHGIDIVRLSDKARNVEVSIVPSIGNRAYEMKQNGNNILYFPYSDVAELARHPRLCGIPFLAPWADILNEQAFWANGKRYAFDMNLGNVKGERPSHGLLFDSPAWRVTRVKADRRAASVTSRLEFWRHPDLMAQWPFAHEYEMTYTLTKGVLEVRTTVINLSSDPMPLGIGYHPYFQIPGIPRDEWTAHSPAKTHVIGGEHNVPSGEMRPMDIPNPMPLKGWKLDDGFTDFQRDDDGRAHFSIQARGKQVEILFGPKYPVATVWLPEPPAGQTREFICFEPLTTIISGINLEAQGKYKGVQKLPPGAKWTESFWVRAQGF